MAWLGRVSVGASLSRGACWDVTNHHFSRASELFMEKSNSRLNLIFPGGVCWSLENCFPQYSVWATCSEPLMTSSGMF